MELLFDFLYAIGIGYWCLLSVLLLRDQPDLLQSKAFVLLALVQSAELFLWSSFPLPRDVEVILHFLARLTPAFIWLFCMALFDDQFRLRRFHLSLLGLLLLADLLLSLPSFADATMLLYGMTAVSAGLVLHVIYRLIIGWREDLVEPRRRLRLYFVAATVLILLADVLTDVALGLDWRPEWFNLLFTGGRVVLLFAGGLWILKVDRQAFAFEPARAEKAVPTVADVELQSRLDDALAEGIFLQPDLSVAGLARHLSIPEYRLRALINQSLGFKNFRSFLNEHRLHAVKSALRDPKKSDLPILTIALDCGFASLASFNRVFKETIGVTPTEYRRRS